MPVLFSRCLPAILAILTLCGCTAGQHAVKEQPASNFESLREAFLTEYWQLFPDHALWVGQYAFADQLVVPDEQSQARRRDFMQRSLGELESHLASGMAGEARLDALILRDFASAWLWRADTLRERKWRPDRYNVATALNRLLVTEYAPLETRLRSVAARLELVPAYYEAVQTRLRNPTLPHLALAIQQIWGGLAVLDRVLPDSVAESSLPVSERLDVLRLGQAARGAMTTHVRWLESLETSLTASGDARPFRLGERLFDAKFKHDIGTDRTAREVYEEALHTRTTVHAEMFTLTITLWPRYFPDVTMPTGRLDAIAMMIDRLAEDHVQPHAFVDAVRDQIPRLADFVEQHQLVTMDPERPLVVRETPPWQRGFAGASISAPGPFDPTANTWYNVSPLTDMDEAAATSWLREYNNYTLQILNIHEAIPGHYLQLLNANNATSPIRAIFRNGAMIEGWGLYAERMMLDAGYGDGQPELWLMYYKWFLRSVTNTILDREIHVMDLSREDAIAMMREQAFQEETEAVKKWRRATLSQVQLSSYFTGFLEIMALREARRETLGDAFDLRTFHDRFLALGSIPVRYAHNILEESDR